MKNDVSITDYPVSRKGAMPLLFIYAADVQRLTRKSSRHAQKVLQQIRETLGKERHQGVTVVEYAAHMGLEVEVVVRCLGF